MGALDKLKAFAGTRKGKVTLGGTAVGGVAVAGLIARKRGQGDAGGVTDAAQDAAAYSIAPGVNASGGGISGSGSGGDVYDEGSSVGNDALAELILQLGKAADNLGEISRTPTATGGATAAAKVELHRIGVVGQSYGLRDIAKRYAPDPNNPNSVEAMLRRIVNANPDLKGKTKVPGGYALKVPR